MRVALPRSARQLQWRTHELARRSQERQALRARAERSLAARLAETVELDATLRCRRPELNLVETISEEQWTIVRTQLRSGEGGELKAVGSLCPKFCSAFSSAALAVNAFGFFVGRNEPTPLPGSASVLGDPEFEAKRSAGVRGFRPNLNVVFEPPGEKRWGFIERKCLEYLRSHAAPFSAAYVNKARALLGPQAASIYESFNANPHSLSRMALRSAMPAAALASAAEAGAYVLLGHLASGFYPAAALWLALIALASAAAWARLRRSDPARLWR